ncbi:CapA family protein [Luteipulveratus sp. YIM 133132]|uniref:CapA family protein n=1 Tax=Luteipulveratus flavus TaxID=3031728 RepID=UPI0023B07A39|nr:CapA family protein [Luteipulveratus sp. YIM 133132]MDE9367659.1 CapA family protein [Luteipulveratus sp. YIM 133132]
MRGARVALVAGLLAALTACSSPDGTAPPAGTAGAASSSRTSATQPARASVSRPPTASATSPAPSPTAAAPASITISAIGDVLPHAAVNQDAATGDGYDYDAMFAAVKPTIARSTIGICQLETALSADDTRLTRKNTFNSPHELARTLRDVGFDGCSTANNHTWDAGLRGVRETRQVLAAHGLQAAGPTATAAGSGAPARYDAPLRVAHLSLSYSLMNSIEEDTTTTPPRAPWMRDNLYAAQRAEGIIASARRAKADGADLVVVSLHWGSQFDPAVTTDQRTIGDALLRSGAVDLIIGAHPHLIQPCAKINGRYVLYSVGNFLSTQGTAVGSPVGAQDGVVATVRFERDRTGRISQSLTYRPTWVDRGHGHRVVLATPTSRPESYHRTVAAMSRSGCDAKVEP